MSLAAQKATVQQCAAALRTWDISAIQALRSEDFTFTLQPSKSLKSQPQSKAENEVFLQIYKGILKGLYNIELLDEIHDVGQHKAAVVFSSTCETTVGPAGHQGVFVIRFTEGGTKIAEMEEHTDSAAMLELMGKLQAVQGGDAEYNKETS